MPVGGVAAGNLEAAPQRAIHAGELRVRGNGSPFRNIGQWDLNAEVRTGHGAKRLDRDGVPVAGKLVIFQSGEDAVAAHKVVIKNSPGHASGAVKAGRTEAVALHHVNLNAALCIEKRAEQHTAQCAAVLDRDPKPRNERLLIIKNR